MADIRFQVIGGANMVPSLYTLSGSGLAFYGTSAGSSVQIGSYQDNTYVANADGSVYKNATNNIKYVPNVHPSGMTTVDEFGSSEFTCGLSGIKSYQATLGIEFSHSSAVKTQNVQLRIYDRSNINYPASGVNTKVAVIIMAAHLIVRVVLALLVLLVVVTLSGGARLGRHSLYLKTTTPIALARYLEMVQLAQTSMVTQDYLPLVLLVLMLQLVEQGLLYH